MHDARAHHPDTQCVHAGFEPDGTGAVVTPIYQTSTFSFRDVDHGAGLFEGKREGYIYTRLGNPTIRACERAVAILEGGHGGIACASGMAAIHTVFASLLRAGDHAVCSAVVYGPTQTLLTGVMSRFGVESSVVDTVDLDAVRRAMRPSTKLVFVETPGNPVLAVSDLAAIADIAHRGGAKLAVDNTFSSPILQRPLDLGADVVVHSMTKFLNGHADVVAGMIVAKTAEDDAAIRKIFHQLGGCIDPFDAFLVSRGLKTLALRMERHCANAERVARFLETHPKVAKVNYPWLPSHPQHELAKRQMRGGGGVVSFELAGGIEAGKALMNAVRLCTLAVSLGGVETLIEHPASMTHASMGKAARERAGIPEGLVRVSVGIERVEEIIADLDQGLSMV